MVKSDLSPQTLAVNKDLSGHNSNRSGENYISQSKVAAFDDATWRIGSVTEALLLLGYVRGGDEQHVKAVISLLSERLESVPNEETEVSLHKRFSGGMRAIVPTVIVADTHRTKTAPPGKESTVRKTKVDGILFPTLAVSEMKDAYTGMADKSAQLEAFVQSHIVTVDQASFDKSTQEKDQHAFHKYALGYVEYKANTFSKPGTETWKQVFGQVLQQGQEILHRDKNRPSTDHLIVTPPDDRMEASVAMVRVLHGQRAVRFVPENPEEKARLILAFFTASSFAHLAPIMGFHRAYDLAGKENVLAVRCEAGTVDVFGCGYLESARVRACVSSSLASLALVLRRSHLSSCLNVDFSKV